MEQQKIDRINALGKKAKAGTLTPEEQEERQALHREYIEGYKKSLRHTLSRVRLVDADGNQTPLKKKGE